MQVILLRTFQRWIYRGCLPWLLGNIFENGFEATLLSKMSRAFWNGIFQFFANFWVTKLKLFFGKVRQSNKIETVFWESEAKQSKLLNSKLATKSILHNSFEATLRSKRNAVSIWKWSFWSFCKFLGDEVETVFWESETKHWRLLKSKVSHRKHFRNLFWSYLEVKNQCPGPLEKAFFTFLKFLNDEVWSRLLEKRGKMLKTF